MTRRDLLAGLGSAATMTPLFARRRIDRSRVSAITDEIATTPEGAIDFARQYKLQWIELRGVPGPKREYAFLPEADVKAAAATFARSGLRVSFLNTSLLKFTWPGTERAQQRAETDEARAKRINSEKVRFDRRMDDLRAAIRSAHILGVDQIRVFAGMRVADPPKLFPRIIDILGEMAFVAEKEKVRLLIENEAACNIATASELAAVVKALPSRAIGINWDPDNGASQQEKPFPDGYNLLPKNRIGNVQIKGRTLLDETKKLDWGAILSALQRDGYKGKVGLETHYFDGTLIEKSHASIREIIRIVEAS